MVKRNIFVEKIIRTPIEEQKIEVVERKGVGHPDSLADGIADSVSRALCENYSTTFGMSMHHNTDQVEIVGGQAAPVFGGGEVTKPIYILLSGRATTTVDDKVIPVHKIAIEAAKEYLSKTVRNLDVENHVIIDSKISPGSTDLRDVFNRLGEIPSANDTSFGVGHAPFSDVEGLCLDIERTMNSDKFKEKFPGSGEDIKVMGLREDDNILFTIADAMVSKYIPDMDHYISMKDDMISAIKDLASRTTDRQVEVHINTADDYDRKLVYLTVTGTSAEMGDDGSVGRGNRVNGLITPNRSMSMEAAAGKNPVNHVGKMYNLASTRMAEDIAKEVDGIKEVYIRILSQIGSPIDQPRVASIQLILEDGSNFDSIKPKVEAIADSHLDDIRTITELVIKGELCTF
ncbi:MAG: methionine adenosyltransferase [Candidatus Hydrothermarchaeaceae archaeon]